LSLSVVWDRGLLSASLPSTLLARLQYHEKENELDALWDEETSGGTQLVVPEQGKDGKPGGD
jgi:hypothetical protein